MDELLAAIDIADKRRGDGCCYWIEIHGDGSGSAFCEVIGKIFSFSTVEEATCKFEGMAP